MYSLLNALSLQDKVLFQLKRIPNLVCEYSIIQCLIQEYQTEFTMEENSEESKKMIEKNLLSMFILLNYFLPMCGKINYRKVICHSTSNLASQIPIRNNV